MNTQRNLLIENETTNVHISPYVSRFNAARPPIAHTICSARTLSGASISPPDDNSATNRRAGPISEKRLSVSINRSTAPEAFVVSKSRLFLFSSAFSTGSVGKGFREYAQSLFGIPDRWVLPYAKTGK